MDVYTIAAIAVGVWIALSILTALAVGAGISRWQARGEPGEDASDGLGDRFHDRNVRSD